MSLLEDYPEIIEMSFTDFVFNKDHYVYEMGNLPVNWLN